VTLICERMSLFARDDSELLVRKLEGQKKKAGFSAGLRITSTA